MARHDFHGNRHASRNGGNHPFAQGGTSKGDWLYGRRPVVESLRAGKRHFYELRVREGLLRNGGEDPELVELSECAQRAGIPFTTVQRDDLDQLLGPVNHQGVALRVGSFPYVGFDQIVHDVKENDQATVLLLDHIEDPQNVGSLLRTADAAGVTGIVIPEDRSAGVTAAAVRASAGAAEHLRVAHVVNLSRAIDELKELGCWITGLDFGEDAKEFTEIDYKGRCGLVIGNEGKGIGRLVREKCDFIAYIPMVGAVSSLNASVAGGIVMYEVLRQKRA